MSVNHHNSDEQLMVSLVKGDASAFNALYDRYSDRILYYMYKMLGQDEARAQDFTQDVFLKVVENADKFDTSKSFKTWIFTIAANHCKNHFRSQNGQVLEFETDNEKKHESSWMENLYDNNQFMQSLQQEVNLLDEPFKETFILRYSDNLKIKEIAEVLGVPVGTVKSRLNSALKKVTKKLAPYRELINTKHE